MPILITRKQRAAEVQHRFRDQYGPDFGVYPFGDSAAIMARLTSLGDSPSVDDVEMLCPGWTRLSCDECRREVDAVAQVGQPPDYESSTACICKDCATLAAWMFKDVKSE